MIYALNDQKIKINASKAEKGKSYYCPNLDCNNKELIIKKGHIRIPHFAHKSQRDCSFEPESEAHILCKSFFQSLLGLDKQFVEYYGIKGVRPDVLYDQFALEIQCSPITVKEIKRRNKLYKKNGYIAIWIFLEDEFISIKKTKEPKTYYRIKKPIFCVSFEDIGRRNFKFFSFKCENEDIHVSFDDYDGDKFFNEFTKQNELVINTKPDFDSVLEEILLLIKKKKELADLTEKLNSLPKQIQGFMYEIADRNQDVNYAHISARDFNDGVNDFYIGMFIDQIFCERNSSIEEFKEYIENMIIEAWNKQKGLEDWRDKNTIKRNGRKYIPLCRIEKINRETPKAYLVYGYRWIPKSQSYKDDKYIYCEEWIYTKIHHNYKEK